MKQDNLVLGASKERSFVLISKMVAEYQDLDVKLYVVTWHLK